MKKMMMMGLLLGCCQWALAKPLVFATEATYPPFVSMTPDNKMVGFGPDIVHAACKLMHKTCELVNAPWNSLIPSLQLGKYDALFGGMGISKQRAAVVDFTIPYYQNASTFVVSKSNQFALDKAGLAGKTIAVQGGTTFERYLEKTYGSTITVKTYESNMTALLDLQTGRVDAVFLDKPVAEVWLKKPGHTDYITKGNIKAPNFFGPGNAIAVSKNNPALTKALNTALKHMQQDGQLKTLTTKWFGAHSAP